MNPRIKNAAALIIIIAGLVTVVLCAIKSTSSDSTSGADYVSFYDKRDQWQVKAKEGILKACTNAIVGIHSIVETSLYDIGDDPNKWEGWATVDFVNRVGGVERTNLHFAFQNSAYGPLCLLKR